MSLMWMLRERKERKSLTQRRRAHRDSQSKAHEWAAGANRSRCGRRVSFGDAGIFELFGDEVPVAFGFEALPDVDEVGVDTDEDAGFAALDALQDFSSRDDGIGAGDAIETSHALLMQLRRGTFTGLGVFGDGGANEAWMHASDTNVGAEEFVMQRLGKAAHGEFAGAVGTLAGSSEEAEEAGGVDDMSALFFLKQWKKIGDAVDNAPEVDVHEPAEIGEGEFFEIAEQCYAGIVEEDGGAAVLHLDLPSERADLVFAGDIDEVLRNFAMRAAEGGNGLLQSFFVKVREGQGSALNR
jgi:hypothetical protein